jgi:hypothetical protein
MRSRLTGMRSRSRLSLACALDYLGIDAGQHLCYEARLREVAAALYGIRVERHLRRRST